MVEQSKVDKRSKDTVQVIGIDRLNNSAAGNPVWRLRCSGGGRYITQHDTARSYELEEDRDRFLAEPVTLWISTDGKVWDWAFGSDDFPVGA